jgi:hypothetical protein
MDDQGYDSEYQQDVNGETCDVHCRKPEEP